MSCFKKSTSIIKRQQQGTTSFKMQVVKTLHCFYRVSWLNSAKLLSLCNFSFPDGELYYHVWHWPGKLRAAVWPTVYFILLVSAAVYLYRDTDSLPIFHNCHFYLLFLFLFLLQKHKNSHIHTHTHISTHQWATVAVDFGTASDGQRWWRSWRVSVKH